MNSLGIKGVTLFVTQKCNFNCSYCFESNKYGSTTTLEIGKKVIDFLFSASNEDSEYIYLSFFGGEPLLEKEMIKTLVLYGNSKSQEANRPILYNIVTNGSLLDEEFISYMSNDNFSLLLSWDGMPNTQNHHRKNSGHVDYASIIEKNARLLNKELINFSVRMTYTPETVAELSENIKYVLNAGITHIGFVPTYESIWSEESIHVLKSQLSIVIEIFLEYYKRGIILHFQPLMNFLHCFNNNGHDKPLNHFYMHSCHTDTLAVDVSGDIYPCHRFVAFDQKSKYILGNINDNNFSVDKYNDYLFERKRLFCENNLFAGCPAVNYNTMGAINISNSNFEKFYMIYCDALQPISGLDNFAEILERIG